MLTLDAAVMAERFASMSFHTFFASPISSTVLGREFNFSSELSR
jgi:hypothetical protein